MALDRRDTIPIPGPTALPIIGNALDVKSEVPIERIAALGRQYGKSSLSLTSEERKKD